LDILSNSSDDGRRESRRQLIKALKRGSVGLEMAFAIAIGAALGWWLDKYFGTEPWLLMTCVLLGVAASFNSLFRMARAVAREDELMDQEGSQAEQDE
jgi:ATP synthase protein I